MKGWPLIDLIENIETMTIKEQDFVKDLVKDLAERLGIDTKGNDVRYDMIGETFDYLLSTKGKEMVEAIEEEHKKWNDGKNMRYPNVWAFRNNILSLLHTHYQITK